MLRDLREIDIFDADNVAGAVSPRTGNRHGFLHWLLCEYHTIGDWTLNLETGEAKWSDEIFRIHGIEPANGIVPVDRAIKMFVPEDAKAIQKLIDTTAKTGQGFRFQLRLNTKDGSTRLVESIGAAVEGSDGSVKKIAGIFRDVTDEQKAQLQVDHLSKALKTFSRDLPISLVITDEKMNIVEASDYWLHEFGLTRKAVSKKSYYDLFPDMPEDLKKAHAAALAGKRNRIRSLPLSNTQDAPWFDWTVYPWTGADGKVTGVLIASQRQKVEPQKRPAKQVVADHELQLLNHAPSALMCLSLDEKAFSFANKAALQLLGVDFDEAVDSLKADDVLGKSTLEHFRRELSLSTLCEPIKITLDCGALGRRPCFVHASRMGRDNPSLVALELTLAEQKTAVSAGAKKEPASSGKPGLLEKLFGPSLE